MSLPKWLRDRIGEPIRGRGCKAVKCIKCQADVLAGFDEDHCASIVIADPTPLSPLGEALALIENRRSYELCRHGAGLALWIRDHWQIAGRPASAETIIVTDHKCHAAKLPSVEIVPIATAAAKSRLLYDATPPF